MFNPINVQKFKRFKKIFELVKLPTLSTIDDFLSDNARNLIIVNVDDFHNIHTYRCGDTTTISEASHFITILLKSLPESASIPFENSDGKNVHNEKGIDADIIINNANLSFFPYFWLSYTSQKQMFTGLIPVSETHEERVERLLVHSYDDRIEQRQVD